MWQPIRRAKRKLPTRFVLEGNHEHRIKRALEVDPQLEGEGFGISFKDLAFDDYYNEVVHYTGQTPGVITIHGISYAHFLVSGIMGRPIGGEHHASSLISKHYTSCTVGHSHTVDWSVRTDVNGKKIMGLVAGVFQDYKAEWAGATNTFWWSGVVIKRGVDSGQYSPQFVSTEELRKEYGQN
jgi:hypothetical protein